MSGNILHCFPGQQNREMFSIPENSINSVSGERIALYTTSEGNGGGESTEGNHLPHCEIKMFFRLTIYLGLHYRM